jgi:hypothetical protein
MEYSAKTTLPLNSIGIIHSLPVFRIVLHFGIIFTHISISIGISIVCRRGRKSKGLIFHSKHLFLAIHAKGGEVLAQSKRTAPPPNSKN